MKAEDVQVDPRIVHQHEPQSTVQYVQGEAPVPKRFKFGLPKKLGRPYKLTPVGQNFWATGTVQERMAEARKRKLAKLDRSKT